MNRLANGTRITYQRGTTTINGAIVGEGNNALGAAFYVVRSDASGLVTNVLPQQIVRSY